MLFRWVRSASVPRLRGSPGGLNGSYPKSQISPMETGRGILYKVQLPTRTKTEAQDLVARLRREQAMKTFIVSPALRVKTPSRERYFPQ